MTDIPEPTAMKTSTIAVLPVSRLHPGPRDAETSTGLNVTRNPCRIIATPLGTTVMWLALKFANTDTPSVGGAPITKGADPPVNQPGCLPWNVTLVRPIPAKMAEPVPMASTLIPVTVRQVFRAPIAKQISMIVPAILA